MNLRTGIRTHIAYVRQPWVLSVPRLPQPTAAFLQELFNTNHYIIHQSPHTQKKKELSRLHHIESKVELVESQARNATSSSSSFSGLFYGYYDCCLLFNNNQ